MSTGDSFVAQYKARKVSMFSSLRNVLLVLLSGKWSLSQRSFLSLSSLDRFLHMLRRFTRHWISWIPNYPQMVSLASRSTSLIPLLYIFTLFFRSTVVANGTFPGPLITANKGDHLEARTVHFGLMKLYLTSFICRLMSLTNWRILQCAERLLSYEFEEFAPRLLSPNSTSF